MITLSIKTNQQTEWIDITRKVEDAVVREGVSDGLAVIFVPHTTSGVTINEGADPHVQEDFLRTINQVIPFKGAYRHSEGNSPAHIKTSLVGPSLTVMVESGRLVLGTWQSIFLCEFDGPRTRKVLIKLMAS
ncbi:MAG TPA: secondary thiamine-phosphate synthase enzyme YjbQ [Thermodesulfobacteriota bacterium]|nr:secondary thiamine-phosphate synthase enzyme YjbQ [Thermodesulfobacteriota bacterium]